MESDSTVGIDLTSGNETLVVRGCIKLAGSLVLNATKSSFSSTTESSVTLMKTPFHCVEGGVVLSSLSE